MRSILILLLSWFGRLQPAIANPLSTSSQRPLASLPSVGHPERVPSDGRETSTGVSVAVFASLERMARLVDITYCVGTTGVTAPFTCVSRCKDFPSLQLVRTWHTGMLITDSCGYIAVDHGDKTSHGLPDGDDVPAGSQPSILVAFRGTYSIANTIIDLSTVPQEYVPYPTPGDGDDGGDKKHRCDNCTVHMGFLASWQSARDIVIPAVKAARAKHPGYPVHLVGHSLGGAVAALAALEMKLSLGWDDVVVTTLGEPRVGNSKLVEYLDEAFGLLATNTSTTRQQDPGNLPYRRVTHANDPVPLLPLTEWGFRSHAGEIYISKAKLAPEPEDLRYCRGDSDPECIGGGDDDWLNWLAGVLRGGTEASLMLDMNHGRQSSKRFPSRFKLWQLLFAHRDYFWRLGLCVPGGDPGDWWRNKYGPLSSPWDHDGGDL